MRASSLAVLILVGCGVEPARTPGRDAGVQDQQVTHKDAGHAGSAGDAGEFDAGPVQDAGGELDAGPELVDAGPPPPVCGLDFQPNCCRVVGHECKAPGDTCDVSLDACCGGSTGVCCPAPNPKACNASTDQCDAPTQRCMGCGYTLENGTPGPCCEDGSCAAGRHCVESVQGPVCL
jgi:hypothetical protein